MGFPLGIPENEGPLLCLISSSWKNWFDDFD